MDRLQLMELVRARQVGKMSRRAFLRQATAVLGSAALANTLLAACTPSSEEETPPVVDDSQPAAEETAGIVTYAGPEGAELMGYAAIPAASEPRPGIIVVQEWWGLNDHIKAVADRFAAEGYAALAPDLYHGVVTTEPNEARKLAMELGMRDAVAEIEAAVSYLKSQPGVTDRVGIVGFCMGGRLVFETAAGSDAVSAGVAFYGNPLSPSDAQTISAPILSFLGTADSIPVSGLEAMHGALDEAGVENAFQIYDGAQHAFFNDTRASYDAEAAADAWTRTLDWFATHLA